MEVDDGRSRAECGTGGASEATDSATGAGGALSGAAELGGIEGEARQGEPSEGDGGIAALALALEIPALLEFAVLVVLDVPVGTIRLVGSEAGHPGACNDQRERRLWVRRVGR